MSTSFALKYAVKKRVGPARISQTIERIVGSGDLQNHQSLHPMLSAIFLFPILWQLELATLPRHRVQRLEAQTASKCLK
jgi:hypothetical protein